MAPRRLYLHVEDRVHVYKHDERATWQDAIAFLREAAPRRPRDLPAWAREPGAGFTLVDEEGGAPLDISRRIVTCVGDRADVRVRARAELRDAALATAEAPDACPRPERAEDDAKDPAAVRSACDGGSDGDRGSDGDCDGNGDCDRRADGVVAKAVQLVDRQRYVAALALLDAALRSAPGHLAAASLKAKLLGRGGRNAEAAACLRRALRRRGAAPATAEAARATERCGFFLLEAGRYSECAALLRAAGPSLVRLAVGERPAAGEDAALRAALADRGGPRHGAASCALDARVHLHAALFFSGGESEALGVAGLAKALKLAPESTTALLAYSHALEKHAGPSEAMAAVLRAVAASQEDKRVRRRLAELLAGPDAMAALRRSVPWRRDTVPALGFLASLAKDAGRLDIAAELLSFCCAQEPRHAAYALNLAHAHEASAQAPRALRAIEAFLEATSGATVCGRPLAALVLDAWREPRGLEGPLPARLLRGEAAQVAWDADRGVATVAGRAPRAGAAAAAASEDELDALAVAFTLCKVLFVGGRLRAVPPIIAAVEECRARVRQELHRTSVRNEAAYYSCICRVLAAAPARIAAPLPAGGAAAIEEVHVLGDSHCVPIAFHRSGRALLVPHVVTGLKHWHLRSGSAFYPKVNFLRAADALPDGARVVVVLGEIDCREGILAAVEKGTYGSVDEGIRATLGAFFGAIEEQVARRRFRVALHCVLPVLDPTRAMVRRYNAAYEAMAAERGLPWLGFADDLLTPDGRRLRPEYALDGTHAHPRYLEHLAAAMARVWPELEDAPAPRRE